MRRIGLVGELTVVTNLGDAMMRARLAKGTLNALGAHEVRVGAGTDGGKEGEAIHEYEFEACPHLAPVDRGGPLPRRRSATQRLSASRLGWGFSALRWGRVQRC